MFHGNRKGDIQFTYAYTYVAQTYTTRNTTFTLREPIALELVLREISI